MTLQEGIRLPTTSEKVPFFFGLVSKKERLQLSDQESSQIIDVGRI
jgi:hypothetical protein